MRVNLRLLIIVLGVSTAAWLWPSPAYAQQASFKLLLKGSGLVQVHVTLKARHDRIAALARLSDPSIWRDPVAFPRFDASPGDVSYALKLARASGPLLLTSKAPSIAYAAGARARILEIAGDESDAREVLRDCACKKFRDILRAVAVAAYIELRTGHLPNGRIAELTRTQSMSWRTAAAMAMHAYLYNDVDARLNDALRHGTAEEVAGAAASSFDTDHPRVLQAMRVAFARTPTLADRDAIAAYLVAYGDAADLRNVESATLGQNAAIYLSYMVTDPAVLAAVVAGAHADWAQAQIFPSLEMLNVDGRAKEALAIERSAGELSVIYESAVVPNRRTAELFKARRINGGTAPWIPSIVAGPRLAGEFWVGTLSLNDERQLDYLGSDELAQLLGAAKGREPNWILALYLAAHRVATRSYYAPRVVYHDGVERRPFAAVGKKNAFSGVVLLRPQIIAKTLRLELRADLVAADGARGRGDWSET